MTSSFLQIVEPAEDLSLVAITALRAAAGLQPGDTSRDAEMKALGDRISAEIVEACRIATGEGTDGAGAEPTLRREKLTETFTGCGQEVLILSRRHNVKIDSVTENGTAVTLDARSLRSESGLLYRWVDGSWSCWTAREIVVVYEAGFEEVPFSLAGVAVDLARLRLSEGSIDPLVKSTRVEVVDIETVQTDRWVGSTPGTAETGIPVEIMARLSRFINPVV